MPDMKFFTTYLFLVLLLATNKPAHCQDNKWLHSLKPEVLPLDNLDPFQEPVSSSWLLAGNVSADKDVKNQLKPENGSGVLVFKPKQKGSKTLQTKFEHGDIDLNLDFLLSKTASFAILLHGRYEVKISDEWMQNGNDACKAPGLWQKLSVRFKAPVYDLNCSKIKDAVLEEVMINGQQVKKSAAISVSQHSPVKNEAVSGPLIIHGFNSPFAIRNISYKVYKKNEIKLTGVSFAVYAGLHKNTDTLQNLKPKRTGSTDTISHLVGDKKSQLVFEGFAEIPTDGEYLFQLTAGGGAWLFIDGKLMIENKGSRDFERAFYGKHYLKKGRFPFRIVYSNSDECLVVRYEGPQIPWHALTTAASVRLSEKFAPLEYLVKNKPVLQRGFMLNHAVVNPYIAAVGLPVDAHLGINYAYDMKTYSLAAVWHGKYIDVSNMWTERGEKQLEIPLGAKLELPGKPVISNNLFENKLWPDSVQAPEGVYTERGYKLDLQGFPVFYYTLNTTSVEDSFYPNKNKKGLIRQLKISNVKGIAYCLLAEGLVIEKSGKGNFTIDDKKYYITGLETSIAEPEIKHSADGDKLILTLPEQKENITIKCEIIW